MLTELALLLEDPALYVATLSDGELHIELADEEATIATNGRM